MICQVQAVRVRCFVCKLEADVSRGEFENARCGGCGSRKSMRPVRVERAPSTGPLVGPSRVPIVRPTIPRMERETYERRLACEAEQQQAEREERPRRRRPARRPGRSAGVHPDS